MNEYYTEPLIVDEDTDVMDVDVFRRACRAGELGPDDGFGVAVKGKFQGTEKIYADTLDRIPADAERINWFNK